MGNSEGQTRAAPPTLVESRRRTAEQAAALPPVQGVVTSIVDAGGVPAVEFAPAATTGGPVVVYLHGGGYRQGSVAMYAQLMSHIALLTGFRVLGVDYRLAPEHPFPAGPDDVLAAYRHVLETERDGTEILVAGDSAGGGLAACVALDAVAAGLPAPTAVAVMSPWVDLRVEASSFATSADSVFQLASAQEAADMYLDGQDPHDPRISPVLRDWSGAPALFVSVSSFETLYDDATTLAKAAADVGVPVEFAEFSDVSHGWWLSYPTTAESIEVVQRLSDFLRRRAVAAT